MNNRFVVPAGMVDNVSKFGTLSDALTTSGLHAGDIIQIEPGSSPGPLETADIPLLKNLTIQGDPAFGVQSIPSFVADQVTIGSALQGFTLKNVQFDIPQNGLLNIKTDVTITNSRIQNDNAQNAAMVLSGTTASVISNCTIENASSQDYGNDLVEIDPAAGSHNRITDNQFVALTGSKIDLLNYYGGAGTTDVVSHNTFVGNTGTVALFIVSYTEGLTVQGNTFTDYFPGGTAIDIEPPVQNLRILDNVISVPSNGGGIWVDYNLGTTPTSLVIASNHINTGGQGDGIQFRGGIPGTFVAKVENNDLHGNYYGVVIYDVTGGSVAGIDLGGGSQGSLGANNFRSDPNAIYCYASSSEGSISAQSNIFGVADPTTVIHDHHNDPTLAAVVSNSPLTGNAAFVETLYLDFLHRTGNLSDPKDAGIWVTRMSQGMPAATVANLVAHSSEALGVAVDGLYHRFLGRDADAAGRAGFVSYLQAGGTLEGVSQILLASPEYQSRFPTDSSFVQSLYQNLLHRTGSAAEVNWWVAKLPQLGRTGVAQGFLLSQEYRADEVSDDYTWFLHRTGSSADIKSWVNSGKDFLTIDAIFAGSSEFQMNG